MRYQDPPVWLCITRPPFMQDMPDGNFKEIENPELRELYTSEQLQYVNSNYRLYKSFILRDFIKVKKQLKDLPDSYLKFYTEVSDLGWFIIDAILKNKVDFEDICKEFKYDVLVSILRQEYAGKTLIPRFKKVGLDIPFHFHRSSQLRTTSPKYLFFNKLRIRLELSREEFEKKFKMNLKHLSNKSFKISPETYELIKEYAEIPEEYYYKRKPGDYSSNKSCKYIVDTLEKAGYPQNTWPRRVRICLGRMFSKSEYRIPGMIREFAESKGVDLV